jgi:prepilin-type N-terminal cleavage/methylation domain-containing protein
MKKKYFKNKKREDTGFTIIEMMISIGIFLIVVTVGMTALLNASAIHQKSQDTRSILDSLNFMMDDMSRNIRTGTAYVCTGGNSSPDSPCINGNNLYFTSSDGVSHYQYIITTASGSNNGGVQKIITDNPNSALDLNTPLTDSTKIIIGSGSGFTVTGLGSADDLQPFVTIRLVGSIISNGSTSSFSIQTSVSQRAADF